MSIRVSCPSCKSDVHVDESLAGKDILCPSCKERMTVPSIAAGQPETLPADDDRYREGAGPGGLPRWRDDDYDVPSRHDMSRWNAAITGLNIIFWTSLITVVLIVPFQVIAMLMGNNPQMFGQVNPGAPPPPGAMAFGFGMMGLGCAMIVLFIIWYVGMCMCCTVPSESGAKGKAITTVVLIGVSVVVGIVAFIAMVVYTVGQIQQAGGPPPPGQMPFPLPALIGFVLALAIDVAILVTIWLLFHKSIANYFHNERLSKHCVWFIIFYFATAVVTWALNFIANPMFHGGNLLQGPTPLLMVTQVWGLLLAVVSSIWYLYINRETRRTILEGHAEGDQDLPDETAAP